MVYQERRTNVKHHLSRAVFTSFMIPYRFSGLITLNDFLHGTCGVRQSNSGVVEHVKWYRKDLHQIPSYCKIITTSFLMWNVQANPPPKRRPPLIQPDQSRTWIILVMDRRMFLPQRNFSQNSSASTLYSLWLRWMNEFGLFE
jgi:hypothetical protein